MSWTVYQSVSYDKTILVGNGHTSASLRRGWPPDSAEDSCSEHRGGRPVMHVAAESASRAGVAGFWRLAASVRLGAGLGGRRPGAWAVMGWSAAR